MLFSSDGKVFLKKKKKKAYISHQHLFFFKENTTLFNFLYIYILWEGAELSVGCGTQDLPLRHVRSFFFFFTFFKGIY